MRLPTRPPTPPRSLISTLSHPLVFNRACRRLGTAWPFDRNLAALLVDEGSFLGAEVQYAAPTSLSGSATLTLYDSFWPGTPYLQASVRRCAPYCCVMLFNASHVVWA